tara:strand:+ start:196 stop:624 length:429 start_codon:yes stop_codon:yes gene_type:complete
MQIVNKIFLVLSFCPIFTGCGENIDCRFSDRSGSYLTTFTLVSGNCGEIPSTLINIDHDGSEPTPPDGCIYETHTWSGDQCELQTVQKCIVESDNTSSRTTAITQQDDSSGDTISGTISMEIRNNDNSPKCTGTYNVLYERQ